MMLRKGLLCADYSKHMEQIKQAADLLPVFRAEIYALLSNILLARPLSKDANSA